MSSETMQVLRQPSAHGRREEKIIKIIARKCGTYGNQMPYLWCMHRCQAGENHLHDWCARGMRSEGQSGDSIECLQRNPPGGCEDDVIWGRTSKFTSGVIPH